MFLAVTAEEKGLLGQRILCRQPALPARQDRRRAQHRRRWACGARRANFTISGNAKLGLLDMLIAEAARRRAATTAPTRTPRPAASIRSDHFPFAKAGVPAISFGDGNDLVNGGIGARRGAGARLYRQALPPAERRMVARLGLHRHGRGCATAPHRRPRPRQFAAVARMERRQRIQGGTRDKTAAERAGGTPLRRAPAAAALTAEPRRANAANNGGSRMADLTFYTNPQSRGQTVRWMLEEVGEPYETEILGYGTTMKAEPYLSVNPMGKVPAIVPQRQGGDRSRGDLLLSRRRLPGSEACAADRATAPIITAGSSSPRARSKRRSATRPRAGSRRPSGSGCSATAITTSPSTRSKRRLPASEYIAADHFTAADLFVGANVNFMLAFNLLEPNATAFIDYARRMTDRHAYRRAQEIDTSWSPRPSANRLNSCRALTISLGMQLTGAR